MHVLFTSMLLMHSYTDKSADFKLNSKTASQCKIFSTDKAVSLLHRKPENNFELVDSFYLNDLLKIITTQKSLGIFPGF